MHRLHLEQALPPLSLFGHKIEEPLARSRPEISPSGQALRADTLYAKPVLPSVTMHITVEAADLTPLRQLAVTVCGKRLTSICVKPIGQARRMNVWLCLQADARDSVMTAIMRELPCAQFGHFETR